MTLTPAPERGQGGRCSQVRGITGVGVKDAGPRQSRPPHTLDRGRLTQHDGIHSSPRTELDHDLQRTQQGKDEQGAADEMGIPAPTSPPPAPGTVPSVPPPPPPQTLTGGSNTRRSCWGTSFIRKRKARLPWTPQGQPSPYPPFPLSLWGSRFPASQLPHFCA